MTKKRKTSEELQATIAAVEYDIEGGASVKEACADNDITLGNFYRYRNKKKTQVRVHTVPGKRKYTRRKQETPTSKCLFVIADVSQARAILESVL
jgi:hypothetical protein